MSENTSTTSDTTESDPNPTDSDRNDRNDRHRVADADELPEGDRIVTAIGGREIAVFHTNGEFHALSNYCPHQGGPACEGLLSGTLAVDGDDELVWERDGGIVACPWHGWEFDVTDGRHTASDTYRLPVYEAYVEDGTVYVEF